MNWNLVLSMMVLHALTFLTIGPDNLLVISKTSGQGFKLGAAAILGIVSAGLIQVPFVVFGLQYILQLNPAIWIIIRSLGALYLIYMGYRLIINTVIRSNSSVKTKGERAFTAFMQGFITNLTNPKVLLILTVFLPQFVDIELGNTSFQLFVLGLALKLNDLICFTITALIILFIKKGLGEILNKYSIKKLSKIFSGAAIMGVGCFMLIELILNNVKEAVTVAHFVA